MEVLSILKCASAYLGLLDDFDYYFSEDNSTTPSAAVQSDYSLLLKAFNLVAKEVSHEYLTIKHIEEVTFDSSNKFDIADLSLDASEILKVVHGGTSHKFKIFDGEIHSDFEGEASVEYSYIPSDFDDDDELDVFAGRVGEKTFALGTCMEYKFLKNVLDDAMIYQKRFYESLRADLAPKKQVLMPKRRWY